MWKIGYILKVIVHGFRSVWLAPGGRTSVVGGESASTAYEVMIGLMGLGPFCFEVFVSTWEFLDVLILGSLISFFQSSPNQILSLAKQDHQHFVPLDG